jgi:hypothetical protein
MKLLAALACAFAVLAAGCADSGAYPSLAVRPAELLYASGDPERVPVPAPDRPGIAARIAELLAAGRAGDAAFGEALAAAQPLVAKAGGTGSDSWIAAQQAVSRAVSARSATLSALADLDAFAIDQAKQGPVSTADAERFVAGIQALQALSDRQQDQLSALQNGLSRG